MKKVKLFFVVASLVLIVIGAFAGRSKFLLTGSLFAYKSGHAYPISPIGVFPSTVTIGTVPLTVTDAAGVIYSLYYTPFGEVGSYFNVTSVGW